MAAAVNEPTDAAAADAAANPQTAAFVGYSDNRLGTDTVGLTQTGRTFFVKLGYALRP